jgi:hypothetical protein
VRYAVLEMQLAFTRIRHACTTNSEERYEVVAELEEGLVLHLGFEHTPKGRARFAQGIVGVLAQQGWALACPDEILHLRPLVAPRRRARRRVEISGGSDEWLALTCTRVER